MTWQNPEQLFVAQELINKVKLQCCGIKVSFNNSKEVYITGENGVGKTTLLKAIFLTFKAFSILQNYSEIESFAVIANQLSKIGSSSLLGYDSEGHESKI